MDEPNTDRRADVAASAPSAAAGTDAAGPARVTATPAALALIADLAREHGPLLFHQSGGCCDGSSPMCYPAGEFIIGDADVRLGTIGGAAVFISGPQFAYWRHTQLIIDVVSGQGGMFSLENGRGVRFLTRSRLFSDADLSMLAPVRTGPAED